MNALEIGDGLQISIKELTVGLQHMVDSDKNNVTAIKLRC